MKYALISPGEDVLDPNTNQVIGVRLAEVKKEQFEVANPLFWVQCDDVVDNNSCYFKDGSFFEIPKLLVVHITEIK